MVFSISQIHHMIKPIAEKYHIPAIYLFGSYARGCADEDSDLDFLVDTTGTELNSLLSLGSLYNDLEEVFSKKVDVITLNSLTQKAKMPSEITFRENVMKERICIYENTGFTKD